MGNSCEGLYDPKVGEILVILIGVGDIEGIIEGMSEALGFE